MGKKKTNQRHQDADTNDYNTEDSKVHDGKLNGEQKPDHGKGLFKMIWVIIVQCLTVPFV
jgi:hypothetical protein